MENYLEAISPNYELVSLDPQNQWWWHEGNFWGRLEEIEKQEGIHLAYQQVIKERDETIQAQQVIIKGLRWNFTHRGSRERF